MPRKKKDQHVLYLEPWVLARDGRSPKQRRQWAATRVPGGPSTKKVLLQQAVTFPVRCACRRTYDYEAWIALPFAYATEDPVARTEFRDCRCRSTIGVAVAVNVREARRENDFLRKQARERSEVLDPGFIYPLPGNTRRFRVRRG